MDDFLQIDIRPSETSNPEDALLDNYPAKAVLNWVEGGTKDEIVIDSPYSEPFTVITIAFDVTNAKSVTIELMDTGTSVTVCQFSSILFL